MAQSARSDEKALRKRERKEADQAFRDRARVESMNAQPRVSLQCTLWQTFVPRGEGL